ncbi:MAG: hypothetical protein HY547_04775 [Elusimicrobia bacterium]|nr:hypothetical protein [Elusimicrobiota bacterium]
MTKFIFLAVVILCASDFVAAGSLCEKNRAWLAYRDPDKIVESRKQRIRELEAQAKLELNGCFIWWLVADFKEVTFHPLLIAFEKGFRDDPARARELLAYVNKKFDALFKYTDIRPFRVCDREYRPSTIYDQLMAKRQAYPEYAESLTLLVEQMAPSYAGDWGVFVVEGDLKEPYEYNSIYFNRNAWVNYEKGQFAGMRGYWRLAKGIPDVWVIEGIGSSGEFEEWEFHYSLGRTNTMLCVGHRVAEADQPCPVIEFPTKPVNDMVAPGTPGYTAQNCPKATESKSFRDVFDFFGPYISDVIPGPVEYQDDRDVRSATRCSAESVERPFLYVNENPFEWEMAFKQAQESKMKSGVEPEAASEASNEAGLDFSSVEGGCGGALFDAMDMPGPLPFQVGLAMVKPAIACGGAKGEGFWFGPSDRGADPHEGGEHQHFLCCNSESGNVCQEQFYLNVSRCVLTGE